MRTRRLVVSALAAVAVVGALAGCSANSTVYTLAQTRANIVTGKIPASLGSASWQSPGQSKKFELPICDSDYTHCSSTASDVAPGSLSPACGAAVAAMFDGITDFPVRKNFTLEGAEAIAISSKTSADYSVSNLLLASPDATAKALKVAKANAAQCPAIPLSGEAPEPLKSAASLPDLPNNAVFYIGGAAHGYLAMIQEGNVLVEVLQIANGAKGGHELADFTLIATQAVAKFK